MNLLDTAKFPPAITLLGLSLAVEMGSDSGGQSSIDRELAQVDRELAQVDRELAQVDRELAQVDRELH